MPDWKLTSLGGVATISSGSAPPERREGGGVAVMGANGRIGSVSEANFGPGYLVGRVGAAGAITRVVSRCWASDNTLTVVPTPTVNRAFLGHILMSADLEHLATKTAQPLVTQSELRKLQFLLPPLEEQRRIAEILDTIDEAIRATELVIAKYNSIRAGLASDLLTGESEGVSPGALKPLEIPPFLFSSDSSRNSPSSRKENSWAIEELVSAVSSGGTPRAGEPRYYSDSGTPFLRIDDVTSSGSRFLDKAEQSITQLALDETAAKMFPVGTILVTMYGTMGVTKTLRTPMATNQAIAALIPPFRCDADYLAHALSLRRAGLERFAAQTTQPNISLTIIRRFRLPVPPLEEQQRIAKILDSIDETIRANEQKRDKLRWLRSGLAADLLSGRVRTVAA